MKSKFIFICVLILFCAFDNHDIKNLSYPDGKLKVEVGFSEGKYNGHYISMYENGSKKAEGYFVDNCRKGVWTVWDSAGSVRMVRDYKNAFEFITITANNHNGIGVELPDAQPYQPLILSNGVPDYPIANKKDIVMAKLIWRVFNRDNNNLLFDNNVLNTNIINQLNTGAIPIYADHKLKQHFDVDSINNLLANKQNLITGYRIYESYNFYTTFQLSDTRIIALSPIISNSVSGISSHLGWIRFAELRKGLINQKLAAASPSIKNLDDAFYFQYFSSSIYKESNIYNREISDYVFSAAEIAAESDRIDLGLIDSEHNMWLLLTDK